MKEDNQTVVEDIKASKKKQAHEVQERRKVNEEDFN